MRITTVPPEAACGRRAADERPTCGRCNAADYERRNAFLVFITNAADTPADYEQTFIVVRTCDVACHVLVCMYMYTTRTKVKICQSIRCTAYTFIRSELFINIVVFPGKVLI